METPVLMPVALDAEMEKSWHKVIADWFAALFKDFIAFIDELFTNHAQEWAPMPDSKFEGILKDIRFRNLRNLNLPEDLLLRRRDASTLSEREKEDVLERIHQIKTDFYHKCLDDESLIPSYFDGNTTTDSLLAFLYDLAAYQKLNPDDPSIQGMIKTFSETYKFAVEREAISRLINLNEQAHRKQEYVQKLKEKLDGLHNGDSFVYQSSVAHHAVLFEFRVRVVDGKRLLDAKLINSGLGVENHDSQNFLPLLNPGAKYQTYLVEGADLQTVLDSTFLQDIVEQEVPGEAKGSHLLLIGPVIGPFSDLHHELNGVDKLYKLIKVHLLQKANGKKVISDDPRLHHLPQNNGVCSRKIYEYWMRENLDSELEFSLYHAGTMEYSVSRLKLAEHLENLIVGPAAKADSLKDRLFIQPHWVSKGIACLRGDLKTRTMRLIGEELLEKEKKRIFDAIDRQIQTLPTLDSLPEIESFKYWNKRTS